jgi:DmsE family decaheme c-type cytochrome
MKVIRNSVATLLQSVILLVGVAVVAPPASAEDADKAPEAAARKDLVLKGDAKCTSCHDGSDNPQMLAIGKTKHGTTADGRTPSCTSCHGESDTHINKPEGVTERPRPERTFAKNSTTPVSERNEACLSCHKNDSKRSQWMGSTHQSRDVACTSCHQVHAAHDNVRDKRTQPEVCFTCHKEQRAQINRPSHHPIPEGKMACSDCHNPHGSVGPKLVKRDSVNETCYTCHMEKRGPFVHTHEPVAEDCTNCHNPHGTTAESMLKVRPPFLCHQCHTPHGGQVAQLRGQGQSSALLSATTSGKSGINYTMARGCLNCHTQIHGTNNPSTTNPTPQFNFR